MQCGPQRGRAGGGIRGAAGRLLGHVHVVSAILALILEAHHHQGAINAVHSRELLAAAFAAILGGCCATYVERWPRDMPTSVPLATHLSDLRYALRSLLAHGQPLPCALRSELEVGIKTLIILVFSSPCLSTGSRCCTRSAASSRWM